MNLNILDVLPENINTIDLTRSYIYVLELIDDRYYIGRTSNFMQRMNDHFTGSGSEYTKKYKPIKIIEVTEETNLTDERDKTLEYMRIYGYEKVRGYTWCRETLKKFPKIKKNKKNILEKNYDNEDIKELYINENKNIIEIGNILNKSPGSIAYVLEKMKIVERRQLSKGYFDYIFSELYDKHKKVRDKKELHVATVGTSDLEKDELLKVKKRVKDMINFNYMC
jgi:hypothetical protein